ncbi:MAG: glycosyltransferase [Acidobacteriota bacterium]
MKQSFSSVREIKVAFCTSSPELWPEFIEKMRAIRPDVSLVVVSEFPVAGAEWIPWHVKRSPRDNVEKLAWHFRDCRIVLGALILQPRMPVWAMRRAAMRFGGARTLFFNENLDHFMLRPRSAAMMARHVWWRAKSVARKELRPGGTAYTFFWRLGHWEALRRPRLVRRALAAGRRIADRKRAPASVGAEPGARPHGVSVVIPTRDGRELLERLFESLRRELDGWPHEIIVVDNGSSDGTREWLRNVVLEWSEQPLSFASAVNRGIRRAQYSHVLLLNNDMTLEPGFFAPMFAAFERVPDLFCATAQILFPEGMRREETGKAVWQARRGSEDEFFLRCDEPVAGEDQTYVLYGSGGCSLLDAGKLAELGGLGEQFVPAYVEDLDLGWRAWQRGWASVFVAGAKVVHRHRATTSRFFSAQELDIAVKVNFLRWMVSSVASGAVFARLWSEAIRHLNHLAARQEPDESAMAALAWAAGVRTGDASGVVCGVNEELVLALGSGEHAVFPSRAATGRPRVMVVSSYAPFPLSHGGAVRMFNLMREAARDFDQVLVYFADELEAPPAELVELCMEIVVVRREGSHARAMTDRPEVVEEFDEPVMHALLPQLIRKWRPGVVQLEFTQMSLYAKDCKPAATVMVEHDVTFDLYRQLLREKEDWETRKQWERWERFERKAWGDVDRVVVMSDKDARKVGAANAVVLPNGVDLERFAPGGDEAEEKRLLFIGSFAHLPNVLALEWFLREVWPRLQGYTLHIIAGKRPEYFLDLFRDRVQLALDQPGIELEAFVSDPRPAYRRASVVIAPLLASAGTNIKIMEAMAMGKAVVSTAGGVNGLDDLLEFVSIADTGEAFAAAIVELEDRQLCRSRERAARERVSALYGWRAIGERQKALYQSLMPMQA